MTDPDPAPVEQLLGKPDYRFTIPLGPGYRFPTRDETPDDNRDVQLIVDVYRGKYNWYCLVQHFRFVDFGPPYGPQFSIAGIDVYRLNRPCDSYSAQTERGRNQSPPTYFKGKPSHSAYALDFAEIIAGTGAEKLNMDRELIHSTWIASSSAKPSAAQTSTVSANSNE